MPRWTRRTVLALATVVLLAAPAGADGTWTTVGIETAHVWEADSGSPTYIEWTLDGSHLLVLGAGGARTIHILERDLALVAAIESPFDVLGASWSMNGGWLMAWGPSSAAGALAVWDLPSLAPNATVVPSEVLTLATVTAARFFADDAILVVAGRDADDTSRVNVVEVASRSLHSDPAHPENRTVRSLWNDGRHVVCVEDGGSVRGLSTQNWYEWTQPFKLTGEVTAQSFVWWGEWLVGDSNGAARGWFTSNGTLRLSMQLGRGPVQAIAWINVTLSHIFIATPLDGAGSRLQVWREHALMNETVAAPILVREVNYTSTITTLAAVPGPAGNLTIGHADGTVSILHVNSSIVHWPVDDGLPPPPDDGDGVGDGNHGPQFWGTWGYLVVLVLLAGALGAAYVWLARRKE